MRSALLAGASALALTLVPGAAAALTAEAAWESWQSAAADAGVALTTGDESRADGALTLSAVAFAVDGEEGMTVTGSMDEVVFDERADGSVDVTLPDSYPITISGTDDEGAQVTVSLAVSHPGLSLVLSDAEGGGVVTVYEAPEIEIALDEVMEDGDAQDISGTVTLTELAGRQARGDGDVPAIESEVSVAEASGALSGTDPESGGTFAMSVNAVDIASRSSGTLTTMLGAQSELSDLIAEGFTSEGEGGTGEIAFEFEGEGMPESFALSGTIGATRGTGRIDAEAIAYDVAYEDVAFTASGSEIPLPEVNGGLGALQTALRLPSGPEAGSGAMGLTLALRDLTLSEQIWALFDPAGQLPRDPATFVFDIAGQMRFLTEVFSEDGMESEEMPAEVEEMTLEELRLSLAGAELTGEGAFTFDYDAPGPFGPNSPAPDGTLNLRLTGAQGLLETLVQMGLLPEEQAMMARMMTGMVAKPGDGPDTLVSEITVQPDGTVLANGAPLPF